MGSKKDVVSVIIFFDSWASFYEMSGAILSGQAFREGLSLLRRDTNILGLYIVCNPLVWAGMFFA